MILLPTINTPDPPEGLAEIWRRRCGDADSSSTLDAPNCLVHRRPGACGCLAAVNDDKWNYFNIYDDNYYHDNDYYDCSPTSTPSSSE